MSFFNDCTATFAANRNRKAERQRMAPGLGYKGTEASAISGKRMLSGGLGPMVGNW